MRVTIEHVEYDPHRTDAPTAVINLGDEGATDGSNVVDCVLVAVESKRIVLEGHGFVFPSVSPAELKVLKRHSVNCRVEILKRPVKPRHRNHPITWAVPRDQHIEYNGQLWQANTLKSTHHCGERCICETLRRMPHSQYCVCRQPARAEQQANTNLWHLIAHRI